MSFKVVYTRSAVKDIKKLDKVAKKQIKKRIELYSKRPLFHSRKLTDVRIGGYRWRVGSYRVVFDIKGKTIVVLRAGHRREIYRRR